MNELRKYLQNAYSEESIGSLQFGDLRPEVSNYWRQASQNRNARRNGRQHISISQQPILHRSPAQFPHVFHPAHNLSGRINLDQAMAAQHTPVTTDHGAVRFYMADNGLSTYPQHESSLSDTDAQSGSREENMEEVHVDNTHQASESARTPTAPRDASFAPFTSPFHASSFPSAVFTPSEAQSYEGAWPPNGVAGLSQAHGSMAALATPPLSGASRNGRNTSEHPGVYTSTGAHPSIARPNSTSFEPTERTPIARPDPFQSHQFDHRGPTSS